METQYFIFEGVKYIVSPDSEVPYGDATRPFREHLGLTDEQYAAAVAEWNATGGQE